MIHINLWPSNSNQSKQICTTLCYTYAYGEANLFVCVCVCCRVHGELNSDSLTYTTVELQRGRKKIFFF